MENKKLNVLRQVIEKGFGNADLYVIDQSFNDTWIEHQFNMKGEKEALKKGILTLDKAFSNRLYELLDHSVNGDMVWVHYQFTGVHTGSFMGHEPTGKKIMIDVIDRTRIENDKITEHWGIPDRFAVLMQLGILQPAASKVS